MRRSPMRKRPAAKRRTPPITKRPTAASRFLAISPLSGMLRRHERPDHGLALCSRSAAVPRAMIRPSSSITSSSPSRFALGMLWVTTISVVPPRSFSSSSSVSISSAVMGSRPALGSSTRTIGGSSASARARPARLRMPPESAAGILSYSSSRPTDASFRVARSVISAIAELRVPAQRERDVLADADRIEQGGVLKQEADLAPHARQVRAFQRADLVPFDEHAAAIRPHQADDVPEGHALPGPAAAEDDEAAAARDVERDVVEDRAGAEGLRHAVEPDGRRGASAAASALIRPPPWGR